MLNLTALQAAGQDRPMSSARALSAAPAAAWVCLSHTASLPTARHGCHAAAGTLPWPAVEQTAQGPRYAACAFERAAAPCGVAVTRESFDSRSAPIGLLAFLTPLPKLPMALWILWSWSE